MFHYRKSDGKPLGPLADAAAVAGPGFCKLRMDGIPVRLTYDSVADAAYVYLVEAISPGGVARTRASMMELDRAFIAFDFDSDGKLLGLEILGASRVLTADTLRAAEQLG